MSYRRPGWLGDGEGAGVGVMGVLRGLDGMREEGTGNLLGNEGIGKDWVRLVV